MFVGVRKIILIFYKHSPEERSFYFVLALFWETKGVALTWRAVSQSVQCCDILGKTGVSGMSLGVGGQAAYLGFLASERAPWYGRDPLWSLGGDVWTLLGR